MQSDKENMDNKNQYFSAMLLHDIFDLSSGGVCEPAKHCNEK